VKADKEIFMGLMNLHDAFLNASLLKDRMDKSPLINDVNIFDVTDRARFERMWVASLSVLIEAWNSSKMRRVREYVTSKVRIDELTTLLRQGRKDGSLNRMRETRHYMFHRDKRKYWDDGRLGVCGQLEFHLKVHRAFSRILLIAFSELEKEEKANTSK
jgi:hypothetical protein